MEERSCLRPTKEGTPHRLQDCARMLRSWLPKRGPASVAKRFEFGHEGVDHSRVVVCNAALCTPPRSASIQRRTCVRTCAVAGILIGIADPNLTILFSLSFFYFAAHVIITCRHSIFVRFGRRI